MLRASQTGPYSRLVPAEAYHIFLHTMAMHCGLGFVSPNLKCHHHLDSAETLSTGD